MIDLTSFKVGDAVLMPTLNQSFPSDNFIITEGKVDGKLYKIAECVKEIERQLFTNLAEGNILRLMNIRGRYETQSKTS